LTCAGAKIGIFLVRSSGAISVSDAIMERSHEEGQERQVALPERAA
jgi:hypothetical protein